MLYALASLFMILPVPVPPPMFLFLFHVGSFKPSLLIIDAIVASGLFVTPPHPHLATTDRRLHQGRSGSSPPLFAMWLGQGQSLTKHLLQG